MQLKLHIVYSQPGQLPVNELRPQWTIHARTQNPVGRFGMRIDAKTGEVIDLSSMARYSDFGIRLCRDDGDAQEISCDSDPNAEPPHSVSVNYEEWLEMQEDEDEESEWDPAEDYDWVPGDDDDDAIDELHEEL